MNNSIRLQRVITTLSKNLASYCKRNDSVQHYIDYQNSIISELVDVHNSMIESQSHLFSPLEKEMLRLEIKDPSLSGHFVTIRTKPIGQNFSHIHLNIHEPNCF